VQAAAIEPSRPARDPDSEGTSAAALSAERLREGRKAATLANRLLTLTGDNPAASRQARLLAADERHAKAAIYGLNRAARPTQELEEAWIVQALVREDGLNQVEVAELLGRHKSWVCRRLAVLATDSAVLRTLVFCPFASLTKL
jgi:DNA-binding NtrC family response regulator